MGEYADYAWQNVLRRGVRAKDMPAVVIHEFDKIECSECGKMVGGKSGNWGEKGRTEGIRQHMKYKHKLKYIPEVKPNE
jgi:hypothetical protein